MTTRTISVVSTKGGAGKSTLAVALAVEAVRRGERVALLNLDPQDTLEQWWVRRGKPSNPMFRGVQGNLARFIDGQLEGAGFTLAILDTPPAIIKTICIGIAAADLVVVPVRPSMLDWESVDSTVELIEEAQHPFIFVVNAARTQGSEVAQTVSALTPEGNVARTVVAQRIAYVRAMATGASAGEIDDAAQKEIAALWREVAALLPKERT